MGVNARFTKESLARCEVPEEVKTELADFYDWVNGLPGGFVYKGLFILGSEGELSNKDLVDFYNSFRGGMSPHTSSFVRTLRGGLHWYLPEGAHGYVRTRQQVLPKAPHRGLVDEVLDGLFYREPPDFSPEELGKMLPHLRIIKEAAERVKARTPVTDSWSERMESLEDLASSMGTLIYGAENAVRYNLVVHLG